jgi:predicted YcjX-like family ATPase
LRLQDLGASAADTLRGAALYISDILTPTVRLGVTGLAQAGKTVFITALVRTLLEGGAAPPFQRIARIPGFRAYLEPQPDDDVPRFDYEAHLAALAGDPPVWPESTRRISELRLTLEWDAQDWLTRAMGARQRLFIDIVDYPGEWLADLSMLELSYAAWSLEALGAMRAPTRGEAARAFLQFLAEVDPDAPADEQVAIRGARLFTDHLRAARAEPARQSVLGPGRFLLPGDLEGSPLLTFFPCEAQRGSASTGSLGALLERRFESYKAAVARPFFENHFSRIDRQIVLVDALSALNVGAEAVNELEDRLEGVLRAFRPGQNTWLARLFGQRLIDRILFAATKADHLNAASHHRLAAILRKAVTRAERRAQVAGADFGFVALAALRATEDVVVLDGTERYQCIRGVPLPGEALDGQRYDGVARAVVFPGDLPADPLAAFEVERARPGAYRFLRFRPPPIAPAAGGAPGPWPHIGLGRTIEFLLGDLLP